MSALFAATCTLATRRVDRRDCAGRVVRELAGMDRAGMEVSMRRSVQPTYDSRLTGPAYHVTYRLNGKAITFREPIADPFIRGRVTVGWLDLVRSLFRGGLTVEVQVGADEDRVNDVLELDANALVRNSSRRKAFDAQIQGALENL